MNTSAKFTTHLHGARVPCADYSEVKFFHNPRYNYAAFNIRWHRTELRRTIKSAVHGVLTSSDKADHASRDHTAEYPGFPKLEHPHEHYPELPE